MRFDGAYRAFAESIGVAVVVSDADGVAITANTVAQELFAGVLRSTAGSFLESRITDHPWRLLREEGGELAPEDSPAARARATGEPVRDRVVGFVIGNEAPRWLMQSAVPFEREDDPGRYDVVSTYVDITARRELEARLEQQASHDPLTGLANRMRLEERMLEAAQRVDRADRPLTLMLLDVDDFKGCNDLYGHAAGDAVLIALAERVGALVRPTDTVARLGGDEFALVLEGVAGARASDLAAEIIAAVERPVPVGRAGRRVEVRISTSIGMAVRRPGGDLVELELAADDALFAAKHAGKHRAVLHDETTARPGGVRIDVRAEEAHAWAAYIGELRAEIALRKSEHRLPASSGAPDQVFRVLQDVVTRIGQLPPAGQVGLELPLERDLAPFVFHQASVEAWVAQLREDGVLTVEMSREAAGFWSALRSAVEVVGV